MKCHTMKGLSNRKLLSSPSESQKSEIKVSPGCPPEGCGKGLLQASPGEQRRGKYDTGPAQAVGCRALCLYLELACPGADPQLCYCLAGPSRESYLTSLSGEFIFCKMGIIISAPHKIVERIKGAGAQFSSVETNGGLC